MARKGLKIFLSILEPGLEEKFVENLLKQEFLGSGLDSN